MVESGARGSVVSWAVNRHPFAPGFGDVVPYVSVLVRLDEQDDVVIPGLLDDADAGRVEIGTRVEAVFDPGSDEITWRVSG